jgi:hypothetical protein
MADSATRLKHPTAGTVVTLDSSAAEAYIKAGWVDVDAKPAKRAVGRPKKTDE